MNLNLFAFTSPSKFNAPYVNIVPILMYLLKKVDFRQLFVCFKAVKY